LAVNVVKIDVNYKTMWQRTSWTHIAHTIVSSV